MSGHGEKITQNQEKAIAALLKFPSIPEAAKSVGIADRTLFRWLKNEDFQEDYRKAKREVIDHAISQVQTVISSAVQTLKDIMINNEAPPSARVSAARTIIETGIKTIEIQDLDDRITKLEKILSDKRSNTKN